jgi:DhnA family fructose-bisphosphate aldolase class Ia
MNARMNRLFAPDGSCLDVAIDHGFFGERRLITGIEGMTEAVARIVEAAPDAIQLSPGHARLLQGIRGPSKPALVLRTDVANVYGTQAPRFLYSEVIADAVVQAVRLDAACVVVNLLLLPDQPELHHQCVRNVMALRAECDRYEMPLMVEPLAMRSAESGYGVDGDPDKIVGLVRQAAELGADVIKADPTDPVDVYRDVIEAAGGRPVLPRGGGRAPDEEILERTAALIAQGASGIVYGRNIVQHENPVAMTRALMAIVHDGAGAADALALLQAGTEVGARG